MDRVIGIDVSKLRLDVYRLADGRRLAVGNDAGGIAALADQLGLGPPAVTSDRPLSARQEVSDENGRRGQPFSHRPTFPGSVNHAFSSRSSPSTKFSRCLRRWSLWQSPRVLQTDAPRGKKR